MALQGCFYLLSNYFHVQETTQLNAINPPPLITHPAQINRPQFLFLESRPDSPNLEIMAGLSNW